MNISHGLNGFNGLGRNQGNFIAPQSVKSVQSVAKTPVFFVLFVCLSAFCGVAAQAPSFDLIIRNGRIVDGSGSPWYRGDIAIRGDTIARIAPSITESATRIIDARGEIIAPGF